MKEYKVVYSDGVKDYLNECKQTIEKYNEVIIFGASKTGERVYSFLGEMGASGKVKMVVDNDPKKQGEKFHSFTIVNRMEMKKYIDTHNVIVVIASGSAHIIMRQLIEENIPAEKMISFPFGFLQLSPTPYEFFVKQKNRIEFIYNHLSDDKSKMVFTSLLNFKMSRDLSILPYIADDEIQQYFGDGLFSLSNNEHIVDCGAYIGDTLDRFSMEQIRWEKYYCIEADPNVYERLVKHLGEINIPNTESFLFGCWDIDGFAPFDSSNSEVSRIIDDNSASKIATRRIDSVFEDKNVTFLKMDIEGAELKALYGSKKIIEHQRPIMAISIYHSLNDFLDIPEYLIRELVNYKYYIRHYRSMSDSETVFYAVPEERR